VLIRRGVVEQVRRSARHSRGAFFATIARDTVRADRFGILRLQAVLNDTIPLAVSAPSTTTT